MTEIENIIANKELGTFSGKFGGTVDIVSGSEKAQIAAADMLSSLGNVGRSSALSAAAMAAASVATLGHLSPEIVGAGAVAGVISSITKPRIR